MHISNTFKGFQKELIDNRKATIGDAKATIEKEKTGFERILNLINECGLFSSKNIEDIRKMYDRFYTECIFGRSDVQTVTGLGGTRLYELIKALLNVGIIQPVRGHGKGKYKFIK